MDIKSINKISSAIKKEVSSTEFFLVGYLGFITLTESDISMNFIVFIGMFLYYFYIKGLILGGKDFFKGKQKESLLKNELKLIDEKVVEYETKLKSKKSLNSVLIDRLYGNIEGDTKNIIRASDKKDYDELIKISNSCEKSIEGILKNTKLKFGAYDIVLEEINSSVVVKQIITEYGESLDEKGLALIEDIRDEETNIIVDVKLISEVFKEVFKNIYKHSNDGTRVYIKGHKLEDEYSINIKNISKESLNKSYEEFVGGLKGTQGLNLGIIEESVKALGGSFKVNINGDLFEMTLGFKVVR